MLFAYLIGEEPSGDPQLGHHFPVHRIGIEGWPIS